MRRMHFYAAKIVFAGFLGFLSSCTSTPSKSEDAAPLNDSDKKQLEDARAELEIGRNMAGRLLKYYGSYPDDKLVRYVNEVGTLVGRYSDFPDRRYMFEVYNSDDVNAFACPGGYILVSLGAIKLASNEAELAHVFGHEIAHVGKRHMLQTLDKMNAEELAKDADAASKFNDLPDEVKVRKRPEPEESTMGSLLARYVAGSSAGLNILQAAKAGMTLITEKGLGADLEYDADKLGTRYAINAGYSPKALVNFLCRLEVERDHSPDYCQKKPDKPEKVDAKSILDKTHPPIPDRVINITEVLREMKALDAPGAKGRKRYLAVKERIEGVSKNANADASNEEKDVSK